MATTKTPPGKVRDAGSGKYVKPIEAIKRPKQTVTEHDKKPKPKK